MYSVTNVYIVRRTLYSVQSYSVRGMRRVYNMYTRVNPYIYIYIYIYTNLYFKCLKHIYLLIKNILNSRKYRSILYWLVEKYSR